MNLFGVVNNNSIVTADRKVLVLLLFGCLALLTSSVCQLYGASVLAYPASGQYLVHRGHRLRLGNTLPAEQSPQVVHPKVSPFFFLPVPINYADADLLVTLPGVGPVMAARILNHRLSNEPIRGTSDLLRIKGIGPVRAATLEKFITYQ